MIAGYIRSFSKDDEVGDALRDEALLIELTGTDEGAPNIEIAFNNGGERIYLQFRVSDLLREIKETK